MLLLRRFAQYRIKALLLFWLSSTQLSAIQVFYDSSNHLHRDIQYHPEQSARVDACAQALSSLEDVHLVDVAPAKDSSFSSSELNHARKMLVKAHSEEFVGRYERRCRDSRQQRIDQGKTPLGFIGYVDDDTYLTTESYDVCLRAAAGWIRAVDAAAAASMVDGTGSSMALTRPPGHHATRTLSNGFCIFNFCAVAALHVVSSRDDVCVSILDWDVHYGQGTADIVKGHDQIRYASIHQTPAFPYQGEKRGVEHGNILTVPIPADSTWTCGYREKLKDVVLPFLIDEKTWRPDFLIISAGYDALDSDELANVSLLASDYNKAIKMVLERIESTGAQTSIALGLEGGYQLKDGAAGGNLPDAIVETLKGLLDHKLQ